MSHCVSSYFNHKDSEIYSIRDVNNNPHCTLEIVGSRGQVTQIKGKGNGSIHPKYIEYVLKSLKYFKIPVSSSELENLGYVELSPTLWKVYDRCFSGAKYLQFQNSRYMYKYSQPQLKIPRDTAVRYVKEVYDALT